MEQVRAPQSRRLRSFRRRKTRPEAFVSELAEMRPCFTGPSFDSFRVLVAEHPENG
jgi:hypothetical protein